VTRSFNVTPKTTEQHLVVRSRKSEAEVTNKSALAPYTTNWRQSRPFGDSRLCCRFVAGFGNSRLCRQCVPGLTDTKHRAASLRQHGEIVWLLLRKSLRFRRSWTNVSLTKMWHPAGRICSLVAEIAGPPATLTHYRVRILVEILLILKLLFYNTVCD